MDISFSSLLKAYKHWRKRQFSAPSPHFVKQACLLRNGIAGATWVETGTYLGDTTALLAQNASMVYSLEPESSLYNRAKSRFKDTNKIEIINGPSEVVFPTLLPKLKGNVCFWLDGHFSGDGTFKGSMDTPITSELNCIADHLGQMDDVVVMIDDLRLFNGEIHAYGNYPTLDYLVDWSRQHGCTWHIEHDIFFTKRVTTQTPN